MRPILMAHDQAKRHFRHDDMDQEPAAGYEHFIPT